MSLSGIIKEHQIQQTKLKEKNDLKRQQTLDSLKDVSKSLVIEVNQGIVQLFTNQQNLENESKKLHTQSIKFSKLSTNWVQLYQNLNTSVKELGDVDNWSQHIHSDIQGIVKNIDYILNAKNKLE